MQTLDDVGADIVRRRDDNMIISVVYVMDSDGNLYVWDDKGELTAYLESNK